MIAVLAGPLEDARAAGAVGERPDGYVGAVDPSPTPAIQALVDDINAKRRAHYATIAKKNGTKIEAVSAVAGAKLIAKAGKGEMVMNAKGAWVKK